MTGWMTISLAALAALAIIGVVVLLVVIGTAGRREEAAAPARSRIIGVTFVVAISWAAIAAAGAVIAVLSTLVSPEVSITIPVQTFWPALPADTIVHGTTATRVSGGFGSADVGLTGLTMDVRIFWAISQGLAWLIPGAIAALIAGACSRLRAGRPFAPAMARMASITAIVVAVGGVASAVLGDIAGYGAATQLLSWEGAEYPDVRGIENALDAWLPQAAFELTMPFWPIAAGLAFAALAAIFRYGSRLQRDTEGLV